MFLSLQQSNSSPLICLEDEEVSTSQEDCITDMMEKREEIHCLPELGGPTTPWLIYPNGKSMKSHTFCNILEPNKNCVKRIPQMRRKFCPGSCHGWLILLNLGSSDGCSLWNPVSLETIHLPDLKFEDDDDFQLKSCTLSSAPTDPNCMVLIFCSIPLIIYCQLGDTQWTRQSIESQDSDIKHAVGLSDGTIYACTRQHNVVIIRRHSSGCLSLRTLNVERPQSPPETKRVRLYSLESCGELFRVYLYFSGTDAINSIEVFKLDFSQMAWVKVEGLGGQVFFLTFDDKWSSAVSCSADKHSGLEGDCICFTYPEDKRLYIFDMKDDCISVSLPCPDLRMPWRDPFWFIPMTNNRMVDTTKDNQRRTIINDKKMMVKQSLKEMSREEQKVETINSLFFNLPEELQRLIPTHLTSVVDYMNFRAACKPLRSIAPPIRCRSPWLMVVQKGVGFFLDPECNSIYSMNIPELFAATIRFSKDGWLLMSKRDFSLFFFDPFTKTRIELPDMTDYYSFEGICFSSLPTSSDCVIFGIGLAGPYSVIIGWYRLGQENWSFTEIDISGEYVPFSLSCSNPVFYDGAFYYSSLEGRLGIFDDDSEMWTVHLDPQPCFTTSKTYMVECDGELLSVFLDDGGNTTIISRLDRTTMCWVEVKSLYDKMLFLSPSTSMAIETQEKKLQNKIFLPRFWSKRKNDIVFYSLETKKYHSLSHSSFSSCDFYGTKEQLHCSWIQPNLVWRNIP